MLRVDLRFARPGMKLALPVCHPQQPGQILLRIDYHLTTVTIARMRELGVRNLWVRYPSLACLERVVDLHVAEQQTQLVRQVGEAFNATQESASARLPYHQYVKTIETLVRQLISNPQAAVFLGDLSNGDDELMRHSSSVAYLSVLMGLKLEGYLVKQRRLIDAARAREVVNLGIGAMLHDVGIKRLPLEVRARYEQTGDDTDPQWRDHPRLGFELVRGSIAPSAATVVLHHHQRIDGSGYAGEGMRVLSDERIHVFARIAGLAEQFDRMRFPARKRPQPTVAVLRALLRPDMQRRFDREVMRALFNIVPPYPPGSLVQLGDGRWAAVIDHSTFTPCRPRLQLMPPPDALDIDDEPGAMIDLADEPGELFIARFEGRDVSQLNFEVPQTLREMLTNTSYW